MLLYYVGVNWEESYELGHVSISFYSFDMTLSDDIIRYVKLHGLYQVSDNTFHIDLLHNNYENSSGVYQMLSDQLRIKIREDKINEII